VLVCSRESAPTASAADRNCTPVFFFFWVSCFLIYVVSAEIFKLTCVGVGGWVGGYSVGVGVCSGCVCWCSWFSILGNQAILAGNFFFHPVAGPCVLETR
jgi:hypothetical protein